MNKYFSPNIFTAIVFFFPLRESYCDKYFYKTKRVKDTALYMILFNISLNGVAGKPRAFSMSLHSCTEYISNFSKVKKSEGFLAFISLNMLLQILNNYAAKI